MANKMAYFYVLYCKDKSLYAGYTTNLTRRFDEHNQGLGAKYTRVKTRRPLRMIYAEKHASKSAAMQAEYRFKQLSRSQKEEYLKYAGIESLDCKHFILINKVESSDEA